MKMFNEETSNSSLEWIGGSNAYEGMLLRFKRRQYAWNSEKDGHCCAERNEKKIHERKPIFYNPFR